MAGKKGRNWTETELKYFCILANEETDYAHQLDSLALKKSANKKIFEDVKEKLEEYFQSEDFKGEFELETSKSKSKYKDEPLNLSPEKLRAKFKWIKDQWKRLTDRVKTASGKAPVNEPEWYHIINPILSDTQGELSPCTKASDIVDIESDSDVNRDEVFSDLSVEGDESGDVESLGTDNACH